MRLPTVILSRQLLQPPADDLFVTAEIPITLRGTTFTMAQEATALDDEHFAVGRWDGSLEIYRFAVDFDRGPLIRKAVNCPGQEGVQMILPIDRKSFLSSDDESSMALWVSEIPGDWTTLNSRRLLGYDSAWGVVNSAALATVRGSARWVVAGHAAGFISISAPRRRGLEPHAWS